MIVSKITLYNVLKAKPGESEAQTVVEGIKREVKNQFDEKRDFFASKQDIAELRVEIERGFKDNLKWTVATLLVVAGLIIAAIKII